MGMRIVSHPCPCSFSRIAPHPSCKMFRTDIVLLLADSRVPLLRDGADCALFLAPAASPVNEIVGCTRGPDAAGACGWVPEAKDYFALFDYLLKVLGEALR